jgi:UDP-N-acetylglucosamine 4,6-dehydratase (inverting)
MSEFEDKTILITGGTGSFGKMFTSVLLKEHNPRSIRIYSRGELLQWEMQQKFSDERLRFLIGDVRDERRLSRAMNGVDIVVHAAAMKQVPASEYNPMEAVKTNIDGTNNLINSAIDNNVQKVIALSTDKAVHPVNLYGATKMVAEKLFVQGNSYAGSRGTRFSCVRYGNVIGSRGSIIPLILEQKKQGKITITDKRMTRFWLTLEQGAQFVAKCTELMHGGEIFIPKIPSMRLMDLANALAPNIEIEVIGIRPGEKIHEIMITDDESRHAKDMGDFFIVEPELKFWDKQHTKQGKSLPDGFRYSSDNNSVFLTHNDLKKLIKINN